MKAHDGDSPKARILFYVGTIFFEFMLFFMSQDSLVAKIIGVLWVFVSIFIVIKTDNFRDWNLGSSVFWVRLASVAAIIGIMFGAVVAIGTLFGIPWLISAIRSDF